MDDKRFDRMAIPANRGGRPRINGLRPPADVATPPIAAPTEAPIPIETAEIAQPPITGMRCPACGRFMVPRRIRGQGHVTIAHCTLCPARLALTTQNGCYTHVRVVMAQ